jgi:hypothetical protein
MILVSGMPRSGSSLMMQTLNHLGVPLVGEDNYNFEGNSYLHSQEVPAEDQDRIANHNPWGYYDIPFEEHIDYIYYKHPGMAMKILGPILITLVPNRNVERVILCERRDKDAQATSYEKLAKLDVEVMDKEIEAGRMDPSSVRARSIEIYRTMNFEDYRRLVNFGQLSIQRWWRDHNIKFMTWFYEDMLETSEFSIREIQNFLGLKGPRDKAIENIRK